MEQLTTILKPLSILNVELLILGSIAHTLTRLIPLMRRTRKMNWKRWFKKHAIPNTLSTLVALIILLLVSHVPELVEKFGKMGFKFVSFSLGFSGDYTAKQIDRIIGWKPETDNETK